ncbi:ArsR/SmtB family transcription factor [Limosilactobacillus fermentum]|uniref:ArsR/SmtB family transcription factor n=1 Tax=Limosilactobacillus fermentum TaxID=1613 RepID=UPI0021C177DF|nr:helix-turn-helix domain-containing protein [Limosilactobacillus fermentum]
MEQIELLKALANPARLEIIHCLKDPYRYYVHKTDVDMVEVGVCLEEIRRVAGLGQSTVSTYMNLLKRVNLVTATRVGKFTYFKRNEATLQSLANYLGQEL